MCGDWVFHELLFCLEGQAFSAMPGSGDQKTADGVSRFCHWRFLNYGYKSHF